MAVKRPWRFLRNPRFCDDTIVSRLAQCIWPRLTSWNRIPINIDWTHNNKHHKWVTFAASVAIGGRGVMLMMRSYRKGDYDDHLSRNLCEEAFIEGPLQLFPSRERIVLLGDRGFGRTALFRQLHERDISYVIRVSRTVKIKSKRYTGHLRDLHWRMVKAIRWGKPHIVMNKLSPYPSWLLFGNNHLTKNPILDFMRRS